MAMFKYLRPLEELQSLNGFNSSTVPSKMISEVSKQIKEVVSKERRGEYAKHSEEEKATIGKYASEHEVAKTVRHFKGKNLKESSVRDWKKAYEKELNKKCLCAKPGVEILVTSLPSKKRGRPPLLGEKLDKYLQEIIVHMRSRGTRLLHLLYLPLSSQNPIQQKGSMSLQFQSLLQLIR